MRAAAGERARAAAANGAPLADGAPVVNDAPIVNDAPVVPERLQGLQGLRERSLVAPGRLHMLDDDELRAVALVLADRRLSTSQLRGAVPERARTRQHQAR